MILNAEWPGGRPRTRLPELEVTPPASNIAPLEVQSTSTESEDTRADRLRRIPRRRMSGKYGPHSSQSRSPSRPDSSVFPRTEELSLGGGLFPRTPQRPPPLHLAVSDSYVEGAELLCKHPEKLKMDDIQKLECLKIAIQLENTDLVLILVNIISKNQVEGLFTKLVSFPLEAVLEWVKRKFTIDEIYGDLIPSMMVSNKESLVRILQTWPDANESLLHRALMRCENSEHRNKLAMILVDNGVPASKVFMEQQKKPLLHSVIEARDVNFAKLLIEQGANVDVKNEGETPLLVLASLDPLRQDQSSQLACLSLARLLVAHAANAQALDQKGRSLCHRAAAAGNTEFLNWALHDLQLQCDLRDHHSRTPLLLAVKHGCLEAVRQLLEHTVSGEEGDDHMRPGRVVSAMEYANMRSSPLLRAMIDRPERKIAIVKFLVEADERAFANLSSDQQSNIADLRNSFHIEVLCWAIDCNFETAFTYLLPKVSKSALFLHMILDGDNVLHSAAGAVGDDYLKTLLQRLTDHSDANSILEATNAHGQTPLDIVVSRGSLEKAAILLRSGAKPTSLQMDMVKEGRFPELEALLFRYSSAT
jgi:ankyrin repeat protein